MATLTTVRVAEGSALVASQPTAQSMVIDNYSASYLYCSEAGVYVPPMFGRIIGLPSPLSSVTLMWQTPPGVPVPTPGAPPGYATCIFSNQQADTSMATSLTENVNITNASIPIAGTVDATITNASIPVTGTVDVTSGDMTIVSGQDGSINVSTDSPPIPIGSITIDATRSTGDNTYSLQNEWTGIVVELTAAVYAYSPTSVEIVITDSASNVVAKTIVSVPNTNTDPVVVPVFGNIDGGTGFVSVTITTNSPLATTMVVAHVGALLGTGLQTVINNQLQPLYVTTTTSIAANSSTLGGFSYTNGATVVALAQVANRFLRGFTASWAIVNPTATAEATLMLKGATSGTVMPLDSVAVGNAIAGYCPHVKDLGNRPIDLLACFPNDLVVNVILTCGTGVAVGLEMEATPN